MPTMIQPVTGRQLLKYLEQSCIVLEDASSDARDCLHNLPDDVQRRITCNLQIVHAVIRYLDRWVLPGLVTDPGFRELLALPDSQALVERFADRVRDLSLRLHRAQRPLN